jgi:hypothetical protein
LIVYRDYEGRRIRLPDERLSHILLQHPEIVGMESAITGTLESPEEVRWSTRDPLQVTLYYRRYTRSIAGDKYMCVVVKILGDDAFVLTAYLTDRIKQGDLIWPPNR